MTSVAELVNTIRTDILMTGGRDARNRLASSPTVDSTTVTLEFVHNLTNGDKLSIGYEDMGVWGAAGQTITVERGDDGTAASAHAQGTKVLINAQFTPGQVLRSIQAEIVALNSEPGLYVPSFTTITAVPGDWTYPLTDLTPDQIIKVEGESPSDEDEWFPIYDWSVQRDATGTHLVLHNGWDGSVRVTYKADFTTVDSDTADVAATAGVGDPMLVGVGAALRLTRGRAIRRSFIDAQGDSRRANEVQGFTTENSDSKLEAWYRDLKQAERRRLIQLNPPRRRR